MTSLTERGVIGGVDTHADVHVAAVIDEVGHLLGSESFDTTARGYRRLLRWLRRHGEVVRVGVEGTGTYGAGLARFLTGAGVAVVEVDRPDRRLRRRRGKSDPLDAEAAARAALSGEAAGAPKSRDGAVEMIRALRVARRSALKARTQAANQIHALVVAAPEELRAQLRALRTTEVVAKAARFRPGDLSSPADATKYALAEIARRHVALTAEIERLEAAIAPLVTKAAPALVGRRAVGIDTAGALLVVVGDNPQRLRSEAAFAALCGVSPLDASSGRQQRHRLNRGGDRVANNAIWRIVVVRMGCDPRTKAYVERRTKEGLTKGEIIRGLKRYVARELYADLRALQL